MHDWRILFVILLLCSPIQTKRSGGGGGSNRGQSASRGQVASGGGFNQGGGVNQGGFNQGGVRPQSNSPGGGIRPNPQQPHNVGQPNNFNRGPSNNFHPAPKTSSNTFGKALLGGAAGALGAIVIYEGAKAIIRSATEPFPYQGRNYYWDQNYKGDRNQVTCRMPLSQLQQDINKEANISTTTLSTVGSDTTTIAAISTTPSVSQTISNLQFQDGTKPREITWGCRKGAETCCGMDCCAVPVNTAQNKDHSNVATVLLIILLIILIGGCCCCFIAYMMCRSAFDCIFPRDHNKHDNTYPQNAEYDQPQQQYPMQQYSSNYPSQQYQQPFAAQYSAPQGYSSAQQSYPSTYPSHPTY